MNCWDKEIFYLNNDVNFINLTDDEFKKLNDLEEINDIRN